MKFLNKDRRSASALAALLFAASLGYLLLLAWLAKSISPLSDDWGLIQVGPGLFTTPWPGPFYRPLVRLCFYLAGSHSWNPVLLHVTNIILHGIASIAVFLVSREILGREKLPVAWAAALLFMVLPVHTDNVFWISGWFDLLCGIFYSLAVFCYVRFLSRQTYLRLLSTLIFFWGALLSKEMALSLPGVLLIVTAFRGRILKRVAWWALTPLLLSYLLYFVIRWRVTGHFLYSPINLSLSFNVVLRSMGNAAGSLFRTDTYVVGFAVLLATALLVLWSFRDRDHRRDCLFLSSLLVVSLIPLAGHIARWYLYIPSMFACPVAARAWLTPSGKRLVSRTTAAVFALLLLYYGAKLLEEGVAWQEASRISQRTLVFLSEFVKEEEGRLYLINVPSAYSPRGTVGEKPIFPYNLPLALSITADSKADSSVVVVNHLWLFEDAPGISRISETGEATFALECSDLGFFSFHTLEFVSGKRNPEGSVLNEPWGRLDILNKRRMLIRFDDPEGKTILYYDGHSWSRIAGRAEGTHHSPQSLESSRSSDQGSPAGATPSTVP